MWFSLGIAWGAAPGVASVPVEAWIAPGPAELSASLARAERSLLRSETVGEAAERLQNRWGALRETGQSAPCETDPEGSSVAARILVFGPAWRDDVQSARAEADRLEYLVASPTVIPLLDPETWRRVDLVRSRTAREVAGFSAFAAWHGKYFLASARGCQTAVGPAAGIGNTAPSAPEELGAPVAVIGIGGGVVCPAGVPADGRVAVLPGPEACMAGPDCACDVVPVDPGAVLYGRGR